MDVTFHEHMLYYSQKIDDFSLHGESKEEVHNHNDMEFLAMFHNDMEFLDMFQRIDTSSIESERPADSSEDGSSANSKKSLIGSVNYEKIQSMIVHYLLLLQ